MRGTTGGRCEMTLELRGVRKSYPQPDGGRLPVLNISQFQLAAGEQMALLGQSGGGKTTLLNVIAGITLPDAGQVLLDGVELSRLPEAGRDRFRARKIGVVYQTFNLLPAFTALENVLVGMSFAGGVDRRRALDLLRQVGLERRAGHKPGQMSVGEQQRVAVARALANRPSLLLADEPTANVDPRNQQAVLDLIRESCAEGQVALLLVTHSHEAASQFSRVDRLDQFNHPELVAP